VRELIHTSGRLQGECLGGVAVENAPLGYSVDVGR
jgi:hypothetical protein